MAYICLLPYSLSPLMCQFTVSVTISVTVSVTVSATISVTVSVTVSVTLSVNLNPIVLLQFLSPFLNVSVPSYSYLLISRGIFSPRNAITQIRNRPISVASEDPYSEIYTMH